LPTPKIVATPDGIANELFGDVAMILEFIGCYRGLLMPDKNCPITAGMLLLLAVCHIFVLITLNRMFIGHYIANNGINCSDFSALCSLFFFHTSVCRD